MAEYDRLLRADRQSDRLRIEEVTVPVTMAVTAAVTHPPDRPPPHSPTHTLIMYISDNRQLCKYERCAEG